MGRTLGALASRALIAITVFGFAVGVNVNNAEARQSYAGIVIDANTGKTLYSENADSPRYPASLTKMMTLYMVFDQLKHKKISKSSRIKVSNFAASRQPSKLYLKPGSSITVEQAIYALVTKSANDVATAVAEYLGGTEGRFADLMTAKARKLGMNSTRFENASGLPNSKQVTTARDMAKLGIALREHFPQYYKYFGTRSFSFARKRYRNHNRLLGSVSGVDGIKTGYTRASGFNLVTSARRGGRNVVAVVLGGKTSRSRDAQMRSLLERYFKKGRTESQGPIIAARSGIDNITTASTKLPKTNVPLPTTNPRIFAERKTASASGLPKKFAELPEFAELPQNVDMTQTGSISADPSPLAKSDWVVQVAALPSHSAASEKLQKIQSANRSVLSKAIPFVQKHSKGSAVYHRARFGGFDSKKQAWSACAQLKRRRISCYAIKG